MHYGSRWIADKVSGIPVIGKTAAEWIGTESFKKNMNKHG